MARIVGGNAPASAMSPYVLSEQEGFYYGRELIVPEQP
jgi:hypothetical protein